MTTEQITFTAANDNAGRSQSVTIAISGIVALLARCEARREMTAQNIDRAPQRVVNP